MTQRPYRGRRIDTKEWVQGYFFKIWEQTFILWGTTNGVPDMIEVDPATVGQYTGRDDYNGAEIYEGADVEVTLYDWHTKKVLAQETVKVEFRDCQFGFEWGFRKEFLTFSHFTNATFELIGT